MRLAATIRGKRHSLGKCVQCRFIVERRRPVKSKIGSIGRKLGDRALALFLCVCMVLTMLPAGGITVQAAGEETVISSDTTWDSAKTISNDVQIADGVTVTVNGMITIEGDITITGGRIDRGSADAYFYIFGENSLTLDGVTVDGGEEIAADESMFSVVYGTLNLKNSTIQNCVKSSNHGGAINVDYGGTLYIENTTIKDCSATNRGGAIYLDDGATATIKSGTFSGNKTTSTTSEYGGGFIYNRASTLTIEGGSFLDNSSTGKGGAIRTAVRRDLEERRRQGQIRLFVPGDEFSPFYEDARQAVYLFPELAKDRDYARTNQGITIVVL